MGYGHHVGRVGALAVALGIGAAVGSLPATAWAAPDSDGAGTNAESSSAPASSTKGTGSGATNPDRKPRSRPGSKTRITAKDVADDSHAKLTHPTPDPVIGSVPDTGDDSAPSATTGASTKTRATSTRTGRTVPLRREPAASVDTVTDSESNAVAPQGVTGPTVADAPVPAEPQPVTVVSVPHAVVAPAEPEPAETTAVLTAASSTLFDSGLPAGGPIAVPALLVLAAGVKRELDESVDTGPFVVDAAGTGQGMAAAVPNTDPTAELDRVGNPSLFSGTVSGKVKASDADHDKLTYAVATQPAKGTVAVNRYGTFTFTPTAAARHAAAASTASAADKQETFTITVSDGNGGSTDVDVTVSIKPLNGAPSSVRSVVGRPDPVTGLVTGAIESRDRDGDPLGYVAGTASNGSVTLNGDGSFTYTPTVAARDHARSTWYTDRDGFDVTVDDGHGGVKTIRVAVTIAPADTAPVDGSATATTSSSFWGVTVKGQAAATDPEGDRITYGGSVKTAKGKLTVYSNGSFSYTPTAAARHAAATGDPDAITDTVNILAKDRYGAVTEIPVTITIPPANNVPTAKTTVGQPNSSTGVVTGAVVGKDADKDALTYRGPTGTGKGDIVVNADGTFTYTPTAAARHAAAADNAAPSAKTDSFTITVDDGHGGTKDVVFTVNIVSHNNDPDITGASVDPADADGRVVGSTHADDADNDTLRFSGSSTTAKGSVVVNADGTFTYTPTAAARQAAGAVGAPDEAKSDTFSITVTDGHGGTDSQDITVTIAPTTTSPDLNPAVLGSVGVGDGPDDIAVSPDGQYVYTANNGSVSVVDAVTNSVKATVPVAGTVSGVVVSPSGTAVYAISNAGDHGTVSVINAVTNTVTASIELTEGGGPSSAAVTPNGQTLVVASHDGTITVIDTATGAITDTVKVNGYQPQIAISPVGNTVWISGDDRYPQVSVLTLATGAVTDIATGDYPSTQGIVLSPDGTRAYVLGDGVAVIDTSTKTVTGTVAGVYGSDIAVSPDGRYLFVAQGDGVLTIVDTTTNGVTKTLSIGGSLDAVAVSADGGRLYIADRAADSVTLVEVYSINAAPSIDDVIVGDPDPSTGVVSGSIVASDANGDPVAFSGSITTGKGSVLVNADGTFTYTPTDVARHSAAAVGAPAADKTDSFEIAVIDARGAVTTASVTVAIAAANFAPTLYHSTKSAPASDGTITGLIWAIDDDGDPISYAGSTTTAKGTLVVDADGHYTYTPTSAARHAAAATGADASMTTDTVALRASDGYGGVLEVPISLTISPLNTEAVLTGWIGETDPVTGVVTGRFTAYDADGDTVVFRTNTTPVNFVLNPDGTFTYTPTADQRYLAAAEDAAPADLVATFAGTLDDGHKWVSGPVPGWTYTVPIAPGVSDQQSEMAYTIEGFGRIHALATGPDGRIYVGHLRESGYTVNGATTDWSHYRSQLFVSIIDPDNDFEVVDYAVSGIPTIDDMAIAADGSVYAIDSGTMIKLDPSTGTVTTIYQTDPPIFYTDEGYSRVVIGPDNGIYAWADDNGAIVRIDPSDHLATTIDTAAERVNALAFDSTGAMYIATNRGLRVVAADGTVLSHPYDRGYAELGEMVTAADGTIYLADIEHRPPACTGCSWDLGDSRIYVANPDGSTGLLVAKAGGWEDDLHRYTAGPDGVIYTLSSDGLLVVDPSQRTMSVTAIDFTPAAMTVGGDGRLYLDKPYNEDSSEYIDGHNVYVFNRGASLTVFTRVPTGTTITPTVISSAPRSLQGLWDIVRNDVTGTDDEGIKVQTVQGADGKNRLIVYLGGTTDDATNQNVFENAPTAIGVVKGDQIETINRAITKCQNDSRCGSIDEIMLVGYSQGGMDAQNIAFANADQPITAVITFGSPIVSNAVGPATLHVQDTNDGVPNIIFDWLHDPVNLGAIALANTLGTVYTGTSGIDQDGGMPWEGTHANVHTYSILGADFAADTDGQFQAVKDALIRFQGTVIDVTEGIPQSESDA